MDRDYHNIYEALYPRARQGVNLWHYSRKRLFSYINKNTSYLKYRLQEIDGLNSKVAVNYKSKFDRMPSSHGITHPFPPLFVFVNNSMPDLC